MPTKDEIYDKIKTALVDALGVDEDEIVPEATLVGDLGAESIDFLDIVFRLEKAFSIKIPRGELFPEDVLTDSKYVQDGRVTEVGLAELRKRMPFANLDDFAKNPVVQDFGNLLTVADMCRFIEGKVGVSRLSRAVRNGAAAPGRKGLCKVRAMRWYWIDRFMEFESGRYAKAVKCVSLAEDHLHDHFPKHPVLPESLVIEGLAQTGGLLVCEHNRFTEKVILAKIPKVEFFGEAAPGDTLVYTATIEYINHNGAAVAATSHKNGVLHAQAEIVFAHLNSPQVESLFDPETFLHMMHVLGAFQRRPRRGRQPADAAAQPSGRAVAAAAAARRRRKDNSHETARRDHRHRLRHAPGRRHRTRCGSGSGGRIGRRPTPRASTPATSPPRSPPRSATGTFPTWARIPTDWKHPGPAHPFRRRRGEKGDGRLRHRAGPPRPDPLRRLHRQRRRAARLLPLHGMMMAGLAGGASLDLARFTKAGLELLHPIAELEQEPNMPAAHLASLFDAQGPNVNCLTACAASSQAIGEAVEIIRRDEADVMLAGGAHTMIHPFGVTGFNLLTALSTRNDEPTRASRPFDRDRDGFVLGEGAGMVVLEGLERALARGAQIYGEIVGYGSTADAFRITDTHPEGRGAISCIKMALDDGGVAHRRRPLHQRPRHQHHRQRQGGNAGHQAGVRPAGVQDSRLQHEEHDGAPDCRGRGDRVDHLPVGHSRQRFAADDQLRDARSGVRLGLHPERRPGGPLRRGPVEQFRLRRAEHRPGLPAFHRLKTRSLPVPGSSWGQRGAMLARVEGGVCGLGKVCGQIGRYSIGMR